MSNLTADLVRCPCAPHTAEVRALETRIWQLSSGVTIRRALPHAKQRLVGAWCFLDHFGPAEIDEAHLMRIGPHPHIGLQTVTWLLEGEVLHRDSLGYTQVIRPGQLNLMTAGQGIAHSEETPQEHGRHLHGLQLWIALPDAHRRIEPAFEHHGELPANEVDGARVTVFIGEAFGLRSPARIYSDVVGADVRLESAGERELLLNPKHEYAVLVTEGAMTACGTEMQPGKLYYLGTGREVLPVRNRQPAQFALVGGEPLGEEVLLWWNFVARTREELLAAREDWVAGRRFGEVRGYDGPCLEAPEL